MKINSFNALKQSHSQCIRTSFYWNIYCASKGKIQLKKCILGKFSTIFTTELDIKILWNRSHWTMVSDWGNSQRIRSLSGGRQLTVQDNLLFGLLSILVQFGRSFIYKLTNRTKMDSPNFVLLPYGTLCFHAEPLYLSRNFSSLLDSS